MAWAGINPPLPRPTTCRSAAPALHVGARVARRRQGDQGRARGHRQRRELAIVTGGLGRDLRRRGIDVRRARAESMVPVSMRSDEARGALATRSTAMMAASGGAEDPVARLRGDQHRDGEAQGGWPGGGREVMTDLTGFAPPNIMSQASAGRRSPAVLQPVRDERPGPQFPLYRWAGRLIEAFPRCLSWIDRPRGGDHELQRPHQLRPGRGLRGDGDIDQLAKDFRASLLELAEAPV